MTIKYLVKLFILISLISHLAAVRADTDVDPNDRHPQADDVIVPMPCGIKMVFKKFTHPTMAAICCMLNSRMDLKMVKRLLPHQKDLYVQCQGPVYR